MRGRAFCTILGPIAMGLVFISPAGGVGVSAKCVCTTPAPDVKAFGDAEFLGATNSVTFNRPIAGIASTRTSRGYWETATDGGVFGFGDAHFYGSTGGTRLNQPVVGIAATPSGRGYWLVARDGGVFGFGDAHFYGSTGATRLNQPVVGIAATPSGSGYWLAAADSGIFGFGDAHFYGSLANGFKHSLFFDKEIVGITARAQGDGYWVVGSDGNVFAFGNAHALGDALPADLSKPVVGIASTRSGLGYWVAGRGTPGVLPGQVTVVRGGHGGGSGEIDLDWTGVPGATGYRVERAGTAIGPFSIAANVNLTTGKATTVAIGVDFIGSNQQRFYPAGPATPSSVPSRVFQYVEVGFRRHYFRVTAYNANGYGPPSVVVCGTPPGELSC